jgi:hypothetical protein
MLRLQVWTSALVLVVLCLIPSDMERYWLAFAGDWSLAHGRILESLQGSWYPSHPWVDQEWLVAIATAWTRAHGIYVLLELLFAASMVAGIVFVAYEGIRTKTHPLIVCAQVGVASIGAVFFAQDRAQTLVWALLPALILLWRSKPWYAVPLLALWANVHGSFPIAILWMLLHLDRRRVAPFVVATLATLLNPLGWHLWVFTVELAHNAHLAGYVSEWMPALQSYTGAFVALLALGPLWLRLGAGIRVNRPVRYGDLLFIAACTLGTIVAIRYSMLLFLTTATVLGNSFDTSAKPMPLVTRAASAFFIAMTLALVAKSIVAAPIVADPWFHNLESGVSFTQCAPLVRARRVFTDELQIGSLVELAGGYANVDGRIDAFPPAAIHDFVFVLNDSRAAAPIVRRSGAEMLAVAGAFRPPPPWRELRRCGSVRLYAKSSGTRSPSKKTPS